MKIRKNGIIIEHYGWEFFVTSVMPSLALYGNYVLFTEIDRDLVYFYYRA